MDQIGQMDQSMELKYAINYFLRSLPILLVWIVAIVIAGLKWTKHRAVSNLVIVSAISGILLIVTNICLRNFFRRNLSIDPSEFADYSYRMAVWGFVGQIWGAVNGA